jgi:hypothetical protein
MQLRQEVQGLHRQLLDTRLLLYEPLIGGHLAGVTPLVAQAA